MRVYHEDCGILCFSKNWNNPVQWAHYADKHKGFCLGFDVPDEHPTKVTYRDTPLPAEDFVARKKAQSDKIEAEMDDYIGRRASREKFEAKKSEFIAIMRRRNRKGTYSDDEDRAFVMQILITKFPHWSYENEYRCFTRLSEGIDGLYYFDFSKELKLVEVIAGIRSPVTRKEIEDALGTMADKVAVWKVRKSCREFAVVKDESSEF